MTVREFWQLTNKEQSVTINGLVDILENVPLSDPAVMAMCGDFVVREIGAGCDKGAPLFIIDLEFTPVKKI